MISKITSNNVLTIGCKYDPPKGGVAQVMYTYSKEVYPVFHCITNSGNGGVFKKSWLFAWGWFKTFVVLLCNQEIRIVHIHTASYNSFKRSTYFFNLAKKLHKKVVLHIHGGGFREYFKTNPTWIKNELLKADYIVALTDTWKEYFQKELHLPHVVTVNNIISAPQIREVEHDGRLHLLFLGFIVEAKGIFDLADVIKEHKGEWEGKLLLHVGGNHEVERLQRFVMYNGLENLIHYEGWVSGERKIELLNLMDAYILPSYIEGLPISILEALSYGKPVISTPVGGIPEVVDEKNGYLFTPGDHKAMYEIIHGILEKPDSLIEKSKNAIESVESCFPAKIANVLESVYKEILSRNA